MATEDRRAGESPQIALDARLILGAALRHLRELGVDADTALRLLGEVLDTEGETDGQHASG